MHSFLKKEIHLSIVVHTLDQPQTKYILDIIMCAINTWLAFKSAHPMWASIMASIEKHWLVALYGLFNTNGTFIY